MKFNSIKTKLILYLAIGLIPIFTILLYVGEGYMKKALYRNAVSKAKMLALEAARDIEDLTFNISVKPKEIANLVGHGLSDLDKVQRLMAEDVKTSRLIYGMALAYLPKFSPNGRYYCKYYYLKGNNLLSKNLIPPVYNYMSYDWFKKPIIKEKELWSEPYFDKGGGNIWMSTYSALIKDKYANIIGVATADVSIKFLSQITGRIKILKTGGAFLFTKEGKVLAPLGDKMLMKRSIAEILSLYKQHDFKDLAERILKGDGSYSRISSFGKKYLIYYTPIRNTDWIIGVALPKSELLLPIKTMELYFAVVAMAGLFVVVIVIVFISKKVTSDIEKIKNISLRIADGNFDVEIPKDLGDESENIAKALDVMQKSLKKYIKDVKEKTRIENELELARRIQSAFIPNEMNINENGFEFIGFSKWARWVGGDFYGVHKIDNEKVLFYLGDVSGKGMSAVLYAVIAKTVIDILARKMESVDGIVAFLNNYLSVLTKHNAFATMFIGLIDRKDNTLRFCNAGHIPPLMFKDSAIFVPTLSGNVPIGVFKDFKYKTDLFNLESFDGMLIFSDGITDALNHKKEEFGEDRVVGVVQRSINKKSSIVPFLEEEFCDFIKNGELYDDTTVLEVVKKAKSGF